MEFIAPVFKKSGRIPSCQSKHNLFLFNHLGESALLCGQTVPEAIHNQVAIKLLKSGLLT